MENKKIVLVACPPWMTTTPPLGVAILAERLLAEQWPVEVIDLNLDLFDWLGRGPEARPQWSGPELSWWSDPWYSEQTRHRLAPHMARTVERIRRMDPAFVGLSCPTLLSTWFLNDLSRRLREACPDVVLIGGGSGFASLPARQHIEADAFDYFVEGDGEISLVALLDALSTDAPLEDVTQIPGVIHWAAPGGPPERPVNTGPVSMSPAQSAFPRFALFDLERYVELALISSRGCTQRCSFCDEFQLHGRVRHRPMNAEWVLDAMRYYAGLGFDWVNFNDLLINGDTAALERLADLLIDADLGIKWKGCLAIRRGMEDFPLEKLRRAGLEWVEIGVESFSNPVLRAMTTDYSAEDAARFIRKVENAGIGVWINLIVGFPGEREEHFAESLGWVDKLSSEIVGACINVPYLLSNTGLWQHLDRHGIEPGTDRPWLYWQGPNSNTFEQRLDRFYRALRFLERMGLVFPAPHEDDRPDCVVVTLGPTAKRSTERETSLTLGADAICNQLNELGVKTCHVELSASNDGKTGSHSGSFSWDSSMARVLCVGATMAMVLVDDWEDQRALDFAQFARTHDAPLLLTAAVDSPPDGDNQPQGWDAIVWGSPSAVAHTMVRRYRAGLPVDAAEIEGCLFAPRTTAPLPRWTSAAEILADSHVSLEEEDNNEDSSTVCGVCRIGIRVHIHRCVSGLEFRLALDTGSISDDIGELSGMSWVTSAGPIRAGTVVTLKGTTALSSPYVRDRASCNLKVLRGSVDERRREIALLPVAVSERPVGDSMTGEGEPERHEFEGYVELEELPPREFEAADYQREVARGYHDWTQAGGNKAASRSAASPEMDMSRMVRIGAADPSAEAQPASVAGDEGTVPPAGATPSVEPEVTSDNELFVEALLVRARKWLASRTYEITSWELVSVPRTEESKTGSWVLRLELCSGEHSVVADLSMRGQHRCMAETAFFSVSHQGEPQEYGSEVRRMLDTFVSRVRATEKKILKMAVEHYRRQS